MKIVNLSELDPAWNWLAPRFAERTHLNWMHVSAQMQPVWGWLPRRRTSERACAAWKARELLLHADSILVSHGPRMAMYGAAANRARSKRSPHLAYSFNFTNLPTGLQRTAMSVAFKSVDRFVVFSNMERSLYADWFRLDIDRIDMIHWAVRPPEMDPSNPPLIDGDYICAIGSQARDYRVLIEAMRVVPHIRLVIVATAESVQGLSAPPNVEIRLNIPLSQVQNILAFSRFMVLPLAGSQVPCGHVTLVSAMHFAKAIVATRSEGIADYVLSDANGRYTTANDTDDMARTISDLYGATEECRRLGEAGAAFARIHCVEQNVVDYFSALTARWAE
jgi:glycosyltransferase involved in cell wall biosynthesis